jgi:serine/threonine protein phosphatase 1
LKVKLYVVADVHGYYSALIEALTKQGWFEDEGPKKLVVCGDMMDRGNEAVKMQEFMMDLLNKNQLIFIRGNHEDLMLAMLDDIIENIEPFADYRSYHIRNGTLSTANQLVNFTYPEFIRRYRDFVFKVKQSDFVKKLMPASINYFETKNYVFVHGWIPCKIEKTYGLRTYRFRPDWRCASDEDWAEARWINGMEAGYFFDCIEDNKTIVCGHWHTSYGHSKIHKQCSEFGIDAIFSPFEEKGILAMDGCTAHTGMVNCIVIEDELLEDDNV